MDPVDETIVGLDDSCSRLYPADDTIGADDDDDNRGRRSLPVGGIA